MSKRYKLIILPEAQQDIREIVLYIARELMSPQAALHLQDAFEEGIQSLAVNPERIKTVEEQPWKAKGVRKLRVNVVFAQNEMNLTGQKRTFCPVLTPV